MLTALHQGGFTGFEVMRVRAQVVTTVRLRIGRCLLANLVTQHRTASLGLPGRSARQASRASTYRRTTLTGSDLRQSAAWTSPPRLAPTRYATHARAG